MDIRMKLTASKQRGDMTNHHMTRLSDIASTVESVPKELRLTTAEAILAQAFLFAKSIPDQPANQITDKCEHLCDEIDRAITLIRCHHQ
jgi:hypothetical protein